VQQRIDCLEASPLSRTLEFGRLTTSPKFPKNDPQFYRQAYQCWPSLRNLNIDSCYYSCGWNSLYLQLSGYLLRLLTIPDPRDDSITTTYYLCDFLSHFCRELLDTAFESISSRLAAVCDKSWPSYSNQKSIQRGRSLQVATQDLVLKGRYKVPAPVLLRRTLSNIAQLQLGA
jgi:hypothetical protein